MPVIPSVKELLAKGGLVPAGPAPPRARRQAKGPIFTRNEDLEEKLWKSYRNRIEFDKLVLSEDEAQEFRAACNAAVRYLEHVHSDVHVTVALELYRPGVEADHPIWAGVANNRAHWVKRPDIDGPHVIRFRMQDVNSHYATFDRRQRKYGTSAQIRESAGNAELDWTVDDDKVLAQEALGKDVRPAILEARGRPGAAEFLRSLQADPAAKKQQPQSQGATRRRRTG